ncbi:hypothetical protein HIM_09227 [Hirsutella minnesotensis 3608]|uniref:HD domain-containing protein n=1 Tax=Hirsutella minnesotensis 3608 TaxID=1043627 RepID=A0A0F7ZGS2_9HYPO|nr:hypothetical protein HIM_09227 [Hirsutella minnesotensis 3608]
MLFPGGLTPTTITEFILVVLEGAGAGPYFGEPISQLQHALQCAALAASAQPPVDNSTLIAALLHDIGQYVPEEEIVSLAGRQPEHILSKDGEDIVGRVGHEKLGAVLLHRLGFSEKVVRLVESHVAAKRFLCAVDADYYGTLSDASKRSLEHQGGPFTDSERDVFASSLWCHEKCQLRKWDDAAKVQGHSVGDVQDWKGMIYQHLNENLGNPDGCHDENGTHGELVQSG